jgi:DNA ligase 4
MLSKNYSPVYVPEKLAIYQFHFLLPNLLAVQNSFEAAVELINKPTIYCMPFQVARDAKDALREIANHKLRPQVGVTIAQAVYKKARSIKHGCQLVGQRRMSVEQKYDGEYCQAYIDLNKARDCIKIFSKSGKDSTNDRLGFRDVLRDSLGLNKLTARSRAQSLVKFEGYSEIVVEMDAILLYFSC